MKRFGVSEMTVLMRRNPGSPRAHLLSGTFFKRALFPLTLGVVLTLIVVSGVPAVFSPVVQAQSVLADEVDGSDQSPPSKNKTDEQEPLEKWISDLSSDSWEVRKAAVAHLIESGQQARPFLEKALSSSDLEVRAQAGQILEGLRKNTRRDAKPAPNSKVPAPAQKIPGQRIIQWGPGEVQIEFNGPEGKVVPPGDLQKQLIDALEEMEREMKDIEKDALRSPRFKDFVLDPFRIFDQMGAADPFEVSLEKFEKRMRDLESQLSQRKSFPRALRGLPDPLDLAGGSTGERRSTRMVVSRNGEVILDTNTEHGRMVLEPMGLTFEPMHPALRSHIEGLGNEGLLVAAVREGSPSQQAGWKQWDILRAVGDVPVTDFHQVSELLLKENREGQFHLIRSGKPIQLEMNWKTESQSKQFSEE
ncbi:MAG: hypothetical protein AAEJ04_08095 [Planctomycetota bacterium]